MTTMTRSRRWGAALTAAAVLGLTYPAAVAAAPSEGANVRSAELGLHAGVHAPTGYCGIGWGSLARANEISYTSGTLENVRAGRHDCFDRLVLDVDDVPGALSYDVRYVSAVRAVGTGTVIPLAGNADLRITLRAPAYDADGGATYTPPNRSRLVGVSGYDTFRQVAWAGSFEGQTTVGLGVRARLPFRVMVLDGPGDGARLVIDVAHRW